ncbi:MAG: hypothetical protein K9N47_22730 [Prosthecobacter sp.]|uniref:hypothetical protein n=1 Tax=Prosthecobacter sp. TaxID=1965333 RepID=UPI0026176E53|nr:hypothetical protein [Prosthecobacter sp.]MCF7788958.1 hypothetical protein [Prosthecobacter sp.]
MKIETTPEPSSTSPPPLPNPGQPAWMKLDIQPLGAPASFAVVIEALLKQPGRILHECKQGGSKVPLILFLGAVFGLAVFGALLGTFSGGVQYWATPLKVVVGVLASLVICLPSLYIFSALGGMEARLSQVAGMLLAMVALTALLLLGFAPVVWIFSQSTESVGFMGFLVLTFWVIALFFGFRLLLAAANTFGMTIGHYLNVWMGIFLLVTLQMSTTLRPLIGTADTLLPVKKKFFMEHWADEMSADPNSQPRR